MDEDLAQKIVAALNRYDRDEFITTEIRQVTRRYHQRLRAEVAAAERQACLDIVNEAAAVPGAGGTWEECVAYIWGQIVARDREAR